MVPPVDALAFFAVAAHDSEQDRSRFEQALHAACECLAGVAVVALHAGEDGGSVIFAALVADRTPLGAALVEEP